MNTESPPESSHEGVEPQTSAREVSTPVPGAPPPPPRKKARRGFAAMSPEKQRELASRGGSTAHARGSAHKFNEDEARAAGRKGGESISRDRDHMASIGRKGGIARARIKQADKQTG